MTEPSEYPHGMPDDPTPELDPAVERFVWGPGEAKVFLPDGTPWKPGDPVPGGRPIRRAGEPDSTS